jgi:anti-sigma regulatory factor (Ser/Thr protein kinase)
MQALMVDGEPEAVRSRTLRLVIPADPRYGKLVRDRVSGFARASGVPEADLSDMLTALGEALANAFEHARAQGEIQVACWLTGNDGIVATVVDNGIGFDAATRRSADPPTPEPTSERGRGFAIMRHCTDHVTVRSIPGRGTSVVLVRYFRRSRRRRVTRVTPGSTL